MDLNPCVCGETQFDRQSAVLVGPDGMLHRYTGACPACGRTREFLFRLPEQTLMPGPGPVRFGGDQPSELMDAGTWLWLSDYFANRHPADLAGASPDQRAQAARDLGYALAALDEVAKFIPAGQSQVPESAVWTSRGRDLFDRERYRFRTSALSATAETYRGLRDGPGRDDDKRDDDKRDDDKTGRQAGPGEIGLGHNMVHDLGPAGSRCSSLATRLSTASRSTSS
jgi:hypothetical protein